MSAGDRGYPESLCPEALMIYKALRVLRSQCADQAAPSDSLIAATAWDAVCVLLHRPLSTEEGT